MRRTLNAILVIAIAVIATLLLIPLVTGDDEKEKPKTITTKVDTADKGKAPDKKIVAPAPVVAKTGKLLEDEGGKDETPPGVAPPEIERGLLQEQAHKLKLPDVLPLAAPSVPGCLSRFITVRRNYGAVRNTKIRLFVVHWSGGPNLPGWQDVNGLTAFGNNPAAGVSWSFNEDREGHCHYNVNVLYNPYTQAGFNRVSVSVEIINVGGHDKPLLTAHGLAVLGRVIAFLNQRFHFGLRRGLTFGCQVQRSGIVDHKSLGPCGGGHPDIGDNSLTPIINAARNAYQRYYAPKRVTATDRITCRKLNYWRTHGRHHGLAERRAVRRRVALARRGVTCNSKGAHR